MSTKVNIEMNVDTKKSEGKIKNVNKALDSTAKGANKAKNSTSGLGNSLNAATGGVAAKIKGIIIALRGAMLATIGWGTALKAVGIGLIITAIFGLKAAFTSSEEGQNKFAKIMSAIGVTTGNLIDVVAEYGNVIMSLYKAVTQLFSAGGWRKSIDTAKTALKGLGAAVDDLVNNTGKEIALAEQVADRLADATKKERQLVVDRAKANRDRADLLQKSVDKEKYNLQERLEFLKKAGEIEETITDKEVELAKVRFDAKVLQNTFSKSTIADLDEEASLKAKVIELETSKLTKAKLVNSQISSLRKQERAENKAIKDQESADQKVLDDKKSADQKVLDDAAEAEKLRKKIAIQQIEKNFRIKNENAEINTKLEKIELEKERKLIELDELNAHEDQKKEVILYYDNLISKTKEENEKKDLEQILQDKTNDSEMIEMAEKDLYDMKLKKEKYESELKIFLLPKDEDDNKNAIVEIRAGTGGLEASLFCSDLFKMYEKVCSKKKWQLEIINISKSEAGGFKEVIFSVNGNDIYSYLKYESGVHRVQRIPKTETQGRVHTSAATVAVLPEAEEVDIQIKESDLRIDVFRAGGPGGQSVNTTDSAVRITHIPSGAVVSQQDEKSQHKNKAKALKILRSRVYEAERRKKDQERADNRKNQIGTGDRSERIRTYNFPQGRVTDHRINLTLHKLEEFLSGEIHEEMNEGLRLKEQDLKLQNLT